jgi:hypothetical protein
VTAEPSDPQVFSLFDAEAVEVGADPLRWVPVRRSLGIGAFGVNAYRAGSGEAVIEDHVESPGQEELYVVLRGRVEFSVGDKRFRLAAGEAIFVAQPQTRRSGVALQAETAVLAIGGWREQPYHSLPWEPIYLSDRAFRGREWAESVRILEREAGEHRGNPFIRYRLACCLAQLGESDAALVELRAAVEARPEMRERAADDPLLRPVRDLDGWPSLGS